jgi:hypothetical protein
LTIGSSISFAEIGPEGSGRRVSELTSGLPRERFGSSGFIDVPTIITTQTEISYKPNERLLPAAATWYVERTRQLVEFVQTCQFNICSPSGKKGQEICLNIQHSTSKIELPTGRCFAGNLNVGR